jgi:DNA-binding MarR family transcriptional regulator
MPLSRSEYEMLAAFRFRLRQFLAFSESAAARVGITQHQYQALLSVRAHRGPGLLTVSELAAQLIIRHHSAVGMLDRLEELGMVHREPDVMDRRRVGIRLTASGQRVFDRLASMHRAELRRIGTDMGRFMRFFARAAAENPVAAVPARRARGRRTRS